MFDKPRIDDPDSREPTYLEGIKDFPEREFEFKLWQVLRHRFARKQPKEFANFAGCSAHLDLKTLDLNDERQRALRLALAGSGARVPGTKFMLRIAYPAWAHFEERLGDSPALPHNWMEALHLSKGGWEEPYEWIGRRHSWLEYIVHWERYEETPSGFRLIARPSPQFGELSLRTEIERVLSEIREFQEHLLPGIEASDGDLFTAHLMPDANPWTKRLRTLDEWQDAAGEIRRILETQLTKAPRVLDIALFEQFMWSVPSVYYEVEADRIRWQIACFAEVDWLSVVHSYFRREYGWSPKDESHPGYSIGATKRWLLSASIQTPQLWNALSGGVLAAVADHDPAFAKRLLNWEDWWL